MKFVLRTSEVKFAHNFAVRRNFTHEVNFTIEDNFTCPKGKLSFSVFSVKDNTLRVYSTSGMISSKSNAVRADPVATVIRPRLK